MIYRGELTEVYKATRISDGMECVIKKYDRHLIKRAGANQGSQVISQLHRQITREINITKQNFAVNNRVEQIDSFEEGGDTWIVFKYYPLTLKDKIEKSKNKYLPEEEVIHYLYQIVQFLYSFRTLNLVHRDIKPANIFIDGDNAVIGDFGAATDVDQSYYIEISTAEYASPEGFLRQDQTHIEKFDIWSIGITTFEMLFGTQEHLKKKGTQIDFKKQGLLKSQIPKNPPVSDNMKDLLIGMLRQNPIERFSYVTILQTLSQLMGDVKTFTNLKVYLANPPKTVIWIIYRVYVVMETMARIEYLLDSNKSVLRIDPFTIWCQRNLLMIHSNVLSKLTLSHFYENLDQYLKRGLITEPMVKNTIDMLNTSIQESNECLKKLYDEFNSVPQPRDNEDGNTIIKFNRFQIVEPTNLTIEDITKISFNYGKRYRRVTNSCLDQLKGVFLSSDLDEESKKLHSEVACLLAKISLEEYYFIQGEWNQNQNSPVSKNTTDWVSMPSFGEIMRKLVTKDEVSPKSPEKFFSFK